MHKQAQGLDTAYNIWIEAFTPLGAGGNNTGRERTERRSLAWAGVGAFPDGWLTERQAAVEKNGTGVEQIPIISRAQALYEFFFSGQHYSNLSITKVWDEPPNSEGAMALPTRGIWRTFSCNRAVEQASREGSKRMEKKQPLIDRNHVAWRILGADPTRGPTTATDDKRNHNPCSAKRTHAGKKTDQDYWFPSTPRSNTGYRVSTTYAPNYLYIQRIQHLSNMREIVSYSSRRVTLGEERHRAKGNGCQESGLGSQSNGGAVVRLGLHGGRAQS